LKIVTAGDTETLLVFDFIAIKTITHNAVLVRRPVAASTE